MAPLPVSYLAYIFGFVLTLLLSVLLLISLPFIITARLLCCIAHKCYCQKQECSLRHCDMHWPAIGHSPGRAVVALHKEADAGVVAQQMNRVLKGRSGDCCLVKSSSSSIATSGTVVLWDQSRTRVQCAAELKAVLNEPHGLPPMQCSCVVIPGYVSSVESGTGHSLLVFSLEPRLHPFCLPRLLSLYSDAQLVFEVEPRLTRPFIPAIHPRLNLPLHFCYKVYQAVQLVCRGPMTVLSHSLKREHPVWKAMSGDKGASAMATSKNRKPATPSNAEDDSSLMPPAGLEEVVVATPKGEINHKISSVSVAPSTRWLAWTKVGHAECLSRAERLLRAATIELLTALVAGALRQQFRDQGIRHPPDVGASICVSCRDFVPVEAARPCESVLLPIRLPTSVEGAVPRAWAVQRRMAKVLDGVLPNALSLSKYLGSLLFPPKLAEKFVNGLYGDNTVQISFLRAGGELSLDSIRIKSMFLFPAVTESVLASFCFVQCGSEMMLAVSLDKNTFSRPTALLNNFKLEVKHLVEQLSMRLLTLSQATFLPDRVPILRSAPDADEYCRDSEAFARMYPNPEGQSTSKIREKADSEYSLEELQQLLTTVQDELDGMRANPQGDRVAYIRKLTELENRMQRFHECITQKLGTGITELAHEDSTLATSAVAELLAPYRQESGITGRRFSREYILVDSSSSNSRKNSRHSF
ncbi:unnamed protein product, partial [Mesorhabditis spiculigera]